MATGHPGRCPGPPTLCVGVLREQCSLVWLSRVTAIQPSLAACGSGTPLRLWRTASNRMFTGHSVVEPTRLLTLIAPQNKNAPQGGVFVLAEREGFGPSIRVAPV